MLTGGGSLLKNLDKLLREETRPAGLGGRGPAVLGGAGHGQDALGLRPAAQDQPRLGPSAGYAEPEADPPARSCCPGPRRAGARDALRRRSGWRRLSWSVGCQRTRIRRRRRALVRRSTPGASGRWWRCWHSPTCVVISRQVDAGGRRTLLDQTLFVALSPLQGGGRPARGGGAWQATSTCAASMPRTQRLRERARAGAAAAAPAAPRRRRACASCWSCEAAAAAADDGGRGHRPRRHPLVPHHHRRQGQRDGVAAQRPGAQLDGAWWGG